MEQTFKTYCEALCVLAEPRSNECDVLTTLEMNIKNVSEKLSILDMNNLSSIRKFGIQITDSSDIRWKWVSLALNVLISMKECQLEKECLLSVRQEKAIRTCLEFVVSLGLLPSLIPGVGIPVAKRCSSASAEWVLHGDSNGHNSISIIELHERLSAVTKILVLLIEADFIRGPILSRHLCDVLAALCQLSMAPLKKPQVDINERKIKESMNCEKSLSSCSTNSQEDVKDESQCTRIFAKEKQDIKKSVFVKEVAENIEGDNLFAKKNEEFQMTPQLWNRLQMERKYFSKVLEKLAGETYQPLVVRDLLLLQGSHDKAAEKGKPAPMWLRRGCANLLNSCLFRKGGVVSTVRAICDVFSVPQSKCDSWAQHVILGKLVVMAVISKKGDASCCKNICSQVMELLSIENIKDSKNYARAGVTCMCMLLDAEEEICKRYILDPLLSPLVQENSKMKVEGLRVSEIGPIEKNVPGASNLEGLEYKIESDTKNIVCDQENCSDYIPVFDINSCIDVIHFCFVENDPGMSLPAKLLAPAFHALLRMFRDLTSESKQRPVVSLLLLKFLSSCGDDVILSKTLDSVLFEGSSNLESLKTMTAQTNSFETQDDSQNLEESEEKLLKELVERHLNIEKLGKVVEDKSECNELGWGSAPLLELVSSAGAGEAAQVVFCYVLQVLPKGGENSDEQRESDNWLVSIAKQSVATQLLCHLLEVPTVSEQVKKNPKDVVSFLGNFLAKEAEKVFGKCFNSKELQGMGTNNSCDTMVDNIKSQNNKSLLNVIGDNSFPSCLDFNLSQSENNAPKEEESEVSNEQNHSEFVLVTLLILKSLCEAQGYKSEQDWWSPLRQILPQIRAFRRESSCPEVRAMAEDVACAILTRGKVRQRQNTENVKNTQEANLSTNISGKSCVKDETGKCSSGVKAKKDDNSRNISCEEGPSEFENALKMSQEKAVHIRGHALISLSKLIASKDPVAMRHQKTLLQIFQDSLKHDDSYIYLAAINGLEKLGYIFPDQVLESLADEFAEISVIQAGNTTFNDVRLKVGEALLRVTRTLGEMAPKYSCLLLNAFLGGVRDGDGLVRASSLSNLGEVCKILSFKLGPITTEVLWCVRCVLETDCAVEARRAAVLVITLLLQGMGVEVFKVLETILPELYRTLKSVRSNDPDELVQVHAQTALEEVDRITIQFLFPPQTLQKKIFVLDPPS